MLVEERATLRRPTVTEKPRRKRSQGLLAGLFIAPAILFLLLFVYLPAAMALILGFFHYHLLGVQTTFAGLSNFRDALSYTVFWLALAHTLLFAAILVPLTLIGSLAIAMLLYEQSRFFTVIRTVVLLPYITPVIATSIGWLWLFNPEYGMLNAALKALHLPPSQWLLSPTMALPAVAFYTLWHGLGFNVVIVLSALSSIPPGVIEAARIDGANAWQVFRRVTMPLISPTVFFLLIVTVIGALQAFASLYALSGGNGGPEYATTTLLLLIYQTAFQYFHFSYAAAMAFLLVLLILGLTLLQGWLSRRWVFYG